MSQIFSVGGSLAVVVNRVQVFSWEFYLERDFTQSDHSISLELADPDKSFFTSHKIGECGGIKVTLTVLAIRKENFRKK